MSSYEEELAEFCDSAHMNDLVDRIKVSISNHTGMQTVTIKLAGFWHKSQFVISKSSLSIYFQVKANTLVIFKYNQAASMLPG